ncbi:proline utilization trans-activator [Purpureocillium lavendulum]|uniref:Proline utilization trans-activator n=1 Tax=Purpureocillium lavendulum TaxID=1247861 RepID=A0AB34FPK2_9HYPO|nr:proline utilization trans-activator [Purpureocillium lavendulum]
MGHDYHWFLWRKFKERMRLTYGNPGAPESKDQLWLCRLLIVCALGETFANCQAPAIHLGSSPHPDAVQGARTQSAPPPPGTAFFEQALVLLKMSYEEPTVEYIETLNLATYYSYSLNRKKAAYMYAGMSARLCNLLRLNQPPPQSSGSNSDHEHQKRVCWTSYCLDKMASSELGLMPSFQPGQVKLEYPSNNPISPEDAGQFHEAEFLCARIQITLLKAEADVFIDMWQSIRDDISHVERQVQAILAKLHCWLVELPRQMSFDCESGIPEAMARMPTMRSLASLYLRWYQCFILLLRPLFLKRITHILSDEVSLASEKNLLDFSNRCLASARTNLCILLGLWRQEQIAVLTSPLRKAKFGFWDSLHLFSSLTILSLAMTANRRHPGSFEERITDLDNYSTARGLLRELVQAGNLTSKGHDRMLTDVEGLADTLGTNPTDGFEPPMEPWGTDAWIEQMLTLDPASIIFNSLEQNEV